MDTSTTEVGALARELADAYAKGGIVESPPSSRGFDLAGAYAVEAELVRLRGVDGHTPVGRKVGFASKAVWRVLKLETLVWAHMYDDTVRYAHDGAASLALGNHVAPKIEPEVVFRLKKPLAAGLDAAAVLDGVEWLALGFEIIDCVFPGWKFQPQDFVAAYGLHTGLIVGSPMPVRPADIPALVEQLPRFKVRLSKNGQLVEEGSGRNSLRSPALCVAELAAAVARQSPSRPLEAGELISSGTLTESQPLAAGDTWSATVNGLDLPGLTLTVG